MCVEGDGGKRRRMEAVAGRCAGKNNMKWIMRVDDTKQVRCEMEFWRMGSGLILERISANRQKPDVPESRECTVKSM